MKGFRTVSGDKIGARRVAIWSCNACGLTSRSAPVRCLDCRGVDFKKWDSMSEHKHFCTLELLQKAGEISSLERQIRFPLMAAHSNGRPVVVGHYIADFVYVEKDGTRVVEDVKGGVITALAAWKLRHMAAQGTPVKLVKK